VNERLPITSRRFSPKTGLTNEQPNAPGCD
jgi:hypothetical protein